MTISVKHQFTSPKVDGGDTTLIRPSNWNAEHTITLAQDRILGRASSGSGAVEEITCTAAARSILDDASIAAILATLGVSPPTTGDIKLTLKTTADTGWVLFNDGTIGSASSGASRANSDTQDLFNLLFANISDANAPLLTSAGSATTRAAQTNAATAWSNNCRMSLPKTLGRALAIAGSGSGLTARALGVTTGTESNTLAANQIPSLTSVNANQAISVTSSDALWSGGTVIFNNNVNSGSNGYPSAPSGLSHTQRVSSANNSISVTYTNASQQVVGNMQPSTFLNAMVKL